MASPSQRLKLPGPHVPFGNGCEAFTFISAIPDSGRFHNLAVSLGLMAQKG